MMNILQQAISDAERFLKEAKACERVLSPDSPCSPHMNRGLVKHSSMLLSRSLSKLRRTTVDMWVYTEEGE